MEGQPALADVPALASLQAALEIALWPLLVGLAGLRRTAQVGVAVAGAAWVGLVAVMAQAGFSGEPRYLLPGVALLTIACASGWSELCTSNEHKSLHPLAARPIPTPLMRVFAVVLAGALLLTAASRIEDVTKLRATQAHQWALAADLSAAVEAAGGRDGVLACGTPYVGPLRAPLMAYRLGVTKRTVEPDAPPHPPGVVFRARRTRTSPPQPDAGPPFRTTARAGTWQVMAACTAN
jgi:hypothetical protein